MVMAVAENISSYIDSFSNGTFCRIQPFVYLWLYIFYDNS